MPGYPKILCPLFLLGLFACANTHVRFSPQTKQFTLLSNHVKDSFDVYVTLPANYNDSQKDFPVIFYMDANLKSGNKLRTIIDEFDKKHQPIQAVFVGVGHFGNYQMARRRDFITPYSKDKSDSLISEDEHYGQAENFYLFLEHELIPYIEKNFRVTSHRSLVGHSLGGLFTIYCLFRKKRLFTNFVALSPSLWVNNENIYDFEKEYVRDSIGLHANLYLCVGGAEKFNFILYGARKMKSYLEKNALQGLHFEYYEFPGETHNSEVPVALNRLLPALK